jgi:hypothetical protein
MKHGSKTEEEEGEKMERVSFRSSILDPLLHPCFIRVHPWLGAFFESN